jgi:Zn-dependent protease with chaperone function
MNFEISNVLHPKEKFYSTMMLIFGIAGWISLALFLAFTLMRGTPEILIFILYGLILWFASYVARALTRAYMIGHYVLVGPKQFPHLHKMVSDGAVALGLTEVPQAFVYNSNGVMNAMALRLVGRDRYIWLTSALIDSDSDEQVRFVIGHELGHHVAGHLDRPGHLLRLPSHFIPFLGPAYSRGRELTCDRIGLYVARNINASRSALQMLACGSAKLNAQMNADAFEQQEQLVPSIAGFILHIFSGYPRLTRRVEAVTQWHNITLSSDRSLPTPSSTTDPVEGVLFPR